MLLHMKILYYCFDIDNRIDSHHIGSLHRLIGLFRAAWNQSIHQSSSIYRAIVQRRVLQCGYAESKRNVLRLILNVLTDGAV